MLNEEVETLRDLQQDIALAISCDLETGSHRGNNVAHVEFAKRYPALMQSLDALDAWITKQEELQ